MAERTPGEVHVIPNSDPSKMEMVMFAPDDEGVALLCYVGTHGLKKRVANARRIAAAWNATQDIPTEALETVARHETAEGRLNALARVPGAVPSLEEAR
jgi:hypothetical protein